jgi:nonsense-mediated mRNA decay protein 3
MALGYDLSAAQLVGLDFDAFISKGGSLPDVILVRKSYEEKRKKKRAKVRGRGMKILLLEYLRTRRCLFVIVCILQIVPRCG